MAEVISKPRAISPRSFKPEEKAAVLDVLNSDEFADRAPAQIFHSLLDSGQYLGSISTFYRILASVLQVKERRAIARHPNRHAPRLLATGPNQVWSWDITRLKALGECFFLYVILDIFSRFVVGWTLEHVENSRLAQRFIAETVTKHGVGPNTLILHSDRGAPMTADSTKDLLDGLGIEASYSRPRTSNDNPFSEAHFKTLKYAPEFPERFGGYDDGLVQLRRLYTWYNDEHHHSALGFLTPAQVHFGLAQPLLDARAVILRAAFDRNPHRFVRGIPLPKRPQPVVWINPLKKATSTVAPGSIQHSASTPEATAFPVPRPPGINSLDPLPKFHPSVSHSC